MNEKQKAYMNYLKEFSEIDPTTFRFPEKTAEDFGLTNEEALSAFREVRLDRLNNIGIIFKAEDLFPLNIYFVENPMINMNQN